MKRLFSLVVCLFIFSSLIIQNYSFAEKNSSVITEFKEERTQNKKLFINPKTKTYTEKIFNHSVHYKGKNGEWEDIDNTILPSLEKNDQYTNDVVKNNYKLHLNKRSDKALKISYKDMSVKYLALKTNKKEAIIQKNEVIYLDAWKASDLQYIVQNDGIKMNIILKNQSAPKRFEFEISSKNLKMVKDSQGISFKDEKTDEFVFQIPKMWVSDSSDPDRLRYENIKEEVYSKNGKTILSISVDDTNLKYPLLIDPTTNLSSYGKVSDDAPGSLVAENLINPIKVANISNISVYADYVDPIHGPQDVNFELYANKNTIPQTFVCYNSCSSPAQNPNLGAVKISNTNQTNISYSQLVSTLGSDFIVRGLTMYGYPLAMYNISITYTVSELPPEKPAIPKNVKIEKVNDYQLKISWDIVQSNKSYRIWDMSKSIVIKTTSQNFIVIDKTPQDKYALTAYDPTTLAESDKVSFTFDPSNNIIYYYINNRLEKVTDQKKNETIRYEYDANGNLTKKYKVAS
ncbi:hypothetical protein MKX42_06130 [Paenibacillus sp. FSL R7-0204]|uniref:hypothetical protein n=1 Tax=Paenibacillus sp. FSL R7-0204 TaxID=2921675 RepID=UPI0030FB1B6D